MDPDLERLRAEVATDLIDHLVSSGGEIATPGDELARLRRDVLRGVSGKPAKK